MTKGTFTALIAITVIVIAIVLMVILRSSYAQPRSDFGTWSDYDTTVCLNEGQGCNVKGVSQRYRTCTPNATTGYGCITDAGLHTFKPEITEVECNVVCYTSVWDDVNTAPCKVYDDLAGTTVSGTQTCRNPDQYTYVKSTRVCVPLDSTGTNACIKSNGSLAAIGETETVTTNCSSIPDCYLGQWGACPILPAIGEDCGGSASECGVLVADQVPAVCYQTIAGEQIPVASSNCYPPDDPGPCPRECFNFPCATYPVGYSNIASLLSDNSESVFVELYESASGDYLCADWASVAQRNDAIANVDVLGSGEVDIDIIPAGDRIRFRIVPSQLHAADGACYLLAHLPFSGQQGIVGWDGAKLFVSALTIGGNVGDSLDDITPQLDLFQFTEASEPWILNHYTPGMPATVVDLYCSALPCLKATLCTEPWANVDDTCI